MVNQVRALGRVTLLFLLAALALPAGAQVFPAYLNYQGKLGDASGNPLTGTYSFEFKLYSAGTGGALLFDDANYTGADAVSVTNGVYSVQIGSLTAGGIPPSAFFNSEVWLEVHVNAGSSLAGAETLSPRERLAASPFAFLASNAEYLGTGVAIATFTAGGNLLVPGGVSASSGSFVNGVTASSGTLLATGAGQYALTLSTSITFAQAAGNGLGIRWGDGTISTTAAIGGGGGESNTYTSSKTFTSEVLVASPGQLKASSATFTYGVVAASVTIPGMMLTSTTSVFMGGNVGIGTMSPATKLHMSSGTLTIDGNVAASIMATGSIQVGTDATACSAANAGAMRYNAGAIEFCNGTAWGPVGGGGAIPANTIAFWLFSLASG